MFKIFNGKRLLPVHNPGIPYILFSLIKFQLEFDVAYTDRKFRVSEFFLVVLHFRPGDISGIFFYTIFYTNFLRQNFGFFYTNFDFLHQNDFLEKHCCQKAKNFRGIFGTFSTRNMLRSESYYMTHTEKTKMYFNQHFDFKKSPPRTPDFIENCEIFSN